ISWVPAVLLLHDSEAEARERQKLEPELADAAVKKLGSAADPKAVEQAKKTAQEDAARRAMAGAAWYAKVGRPGFKGRRFFSVSGDVDKPGVYEVPIGLTLREMIALAGGMVGGRPVKAVAASGPSGGLVPAWLPVREG